MVKDSNTLEMVIAIRANMLMVFLKDMASMAGQIRLIIKVILSKA